MKLTILIFTTLFALTFASSLTTIKSPSIIDSLSHLLYIHLNPIFQTTLQQLIQLIFEFGEKSFQTIDYQSSRSNSILPAPWVSQFFGEVNSIATQWNNHVTDFFSNIPTIFENKGRSLINLSIIKEKLHEATGILLQKLQQFFVNDVNQLMFSFMNKYNLMATIGRKRGEFHFDVLLNAFQQQVSGVFEKAQEQLNRNIDISIDFIVTYWNDLKDRVVGEKFSIQQ